MYKLALDETQGQFHRLNNTNIIKSMASSEEVVVACSTFVCDSQCCLREQIVLWELWHPVINITPTSHIICGGV